MATLKCKMKFVGDAVHCHHMSIAAQIRFTPFDEYLALESSSDVKHEYADASIVCGAILTRGAKDRNCQSLGEAITNPRVVVEVLSKSTEQRDRNERFALFQQLESLEEYVLVSQDERRIEVRRRNGKNWFAETRGAGEMVRVHSLEIAVDAIYV